MDNFEIFLWLIVFGSSQLLRLLVLEKLTPNHMLISYEISKLSNVLIKSKSEYKWYSVILFVFQFISLLFFLEILEYNFCDLNFNTIKNIQERELNNMIMKERDSSINSEIDIEGYIVKREKIPEEKEMNLIDKEEKEEAKEN